MAERERFIDYGKAIMLILIVLFHSGISALDNVTYIALTYFFVVSGYCYTKGKRSVADNCRQRFNSILVLFWVAMLLYAAFEMWRASFMGYGDASICLPGIAGMVYGSSHKLPYFPVISDRLLEIMSYKDQPAGFVDVILPTNCHLWFLPAMFCGCAFFFLFMEKIRRSRTDVIWFTILMVLIASLETLPSMPQLPYGLGRGCYACACMIMGYEMKEMRLFGGGCGDDCGDGYGDGRSDGCGNNCGDGYGKKKWIWFIILAVFAVAMYFLGAHKSALVRSVYAPYGMLGTFVTFAGGISACIVILWLLKFLNSFNWKLLLFIGQNTLTIYTWHMAFLTVFSLLLLKIFNLEIERDMYFMNIIPTDHVMLMVLASVLSVACGMAIAKLFRKK